MFHAIIVEPRKHKALSFVLQNFLANLSEEHWSFIIFHGNLNVDYINKILETDINKKDHSRITLINLEVDNVTPSEYNQLFKTEHFYSHIPGETFLVFQTDSMIFEENKNLIYEFLDYDYVGAPWATWFEWAKQYDYVGNGGLSLRKKSKMLEIINNSSIHMGDNEDRFFSTNLSSVSVKKPNYELAKRFSMETVFSEITFGCHSPWKYINNELLFSSYPKIKQLVDLQSVEMN